MLKSSKKTTPVSNGSSDMNHIAFGTKVIGEIISSGNFRLDGELEGNLISESRVVLGESCMLKGTLKAQNAEISGKVNGIAEISDELVLKKTALINAEITVGKIHIESGAQFNGDVKMGAVVKGMGSSEPKNTEKTA